MWRTFLACQLVAREARCEGFSPEPLRWFQLVLRASSKLSEGSGYSRSGLVMTDGAVELVMEVVVEVCLDAEFEVEVDVESE